MQAVSPQRDLTFASSGPTHLAARHMLHLIVVRKPYWHAWRDVRRRGLPGPPASCTTRTRSARRSTAQKAVNEDTTAGEADVFTYSAAIKRHVQRGDPRRAGAAAVETQTAAGGNLTPDVVTFNEPIGAMINVAESSSS